MNQPKKLKLKSINLHQSTGVFTKSKSKVKYIIITSKSGMVYGAFNPTEDGERLAQKYLEKLKNSEPNEVFKINKVHNLNKFLASVKA